MPKGSLAMRDGRLQCSEAGAGAEGKDQSFFLLTLSSSLPGRREKSDEPLPSASPTLAQLVLSIVASGR